MACIKLWEQSLIWFEHFTPHAQWNWLGPLSGLTSCFYGAIKDDGSCVPCGRVVTVSYEKLATLITPQHHIAWQLLVDSFINKLSRREICRHNEVKRGKFHKNTVLHSPNWVDFSTVVCLTNALIDGNRQEKPIHDFHLRPFSHTQVPWIVVPAKPNQLDGADSSWRSRWTLFLPRNSRLLMAPERFVNKFSQKSGTGFYLQTSDGFCKTNFSIFSRLPLCFLCYLFPPCVPLADWLSD